MICLNNWLLTNLRWDSSPESDENASLWYPAPPWSSSRQMDVGILCHACLWNSKAARVRLDFHLEKLTDLSVLWTHVGQVVLCSVYDIHRDGANEQD